MGLAALMMFFSSGINAQITTLPELPVASQKVTITFDSSKESRLGSFTGDLYAHAGVIIEGNNSWQHVIGNWANNETQPKLTNKGNGIYELTIVPNINTFYSVPGNEKVVKMAFVFRSADGKKQTNDLFVTVYNEGLVIEITQPAENAIVSKNQMVSVSAKASLDAALKLFVNGSVLAQSTGKDINTTYTFIQSGNNIFIAEAISGGVTKRDTSLVFVRDELLIQSKPAAYKKGINYTGENSAALVLWAPKKDFVFVIGDFNNWQLQNGFQMKKDGDFFWLDIPNLEKGKEYVFQYFIDGKIKIADPYSEKVSDPWNDKNISSSVYPGLISYPVGKTSGMATILQTGQQPYVWEVKDFKTSDTRKLVIYELLIRDFTSEHTYKAVREKLDYLKDLNINALELMPVNEFEGNSSWGYNPSFYFAPDKYYGPKNELKKLIDECHKRGIAVIIDMVLNHSYGQSPFVQMYMNNWTITPDNPWYNVNSPNQVYSWGHDFNHEAQVVKELVDSVNSFWLNEYKIDGFRFDFTKGFTNTPGDGWNYDAARIAILKRMSAEIWKRKPGALIILEHLADNREEKELADAGMLLWGNMNGSYKNAGKGDVGGSNMSWGVYDNRGWKFPNLVTYAESHDEERVMVECLLNGYNNGSYNIRQLPEALNRLKLNQLFLIPLPGPKMIWQFGERGYDVSINDFGGRLSEKPPRWEYLNDKDRVDLFKVTSSLNFLKTNYPVFAPDKFTYNLAGQVKWYSLNNGNDYVFAIGNFGITSVSTEMLLPETGKWYEFFTGDSLTVYNIQQPISLLPGGYKLYSTKKLTTPKAITVAGKKTKFGDEIRFYPNPAEKILNVTSASPISVLTIYSSAGLKMHHHQCYGETSFKFNISGYRPGIYLIKVTTESGVFTQKIMVQKNN
jgi:hypothetical protein